MRCVGAGTAFGSLAAGGGATGTAAGGWYGDGRAGVPGRCTGDGITGVCICICAIALALSNKDAVTPVTVTSRCIGERSFIGLAAPVPAAAALLEDAAVPVAIVYRSVLGVPVREQEAPMAAERHLALSSQVAAAAAAASEVSAPAP